MLSDRAARVSRSIHNTTKLNRVCRAALVAVQEDLEKRQMLSYAPNPEFIGPHAGGCACPACAMAHQQQQVVQQLNNKPTTVVKASKPSKDASILIDNGGLTDPMAYQIGGRWSSTASGGTGTTGSGITLTYSVVPDGTTLTSGIGEPNTPSDFRARMNVIYGNIGVWLPIVQQVFNEWGNISGVTYVYEANDDGVPMSNSFPGSLNVRGDVRIGAHPMDGAFNVLAYNYFPNFGDMTIDSNDLGPGGFMSGTANGSRALRNVMAHEHEHGLGFNHVDPTNQTKLMEAFASTVFDGPQFDDTLAVQRNYGDIFEKSGGNNTAATATNRGNLGIGTDTIGVNSWPLILPTGTVSTATTSDQDWYKFTLASSSLTSITLTPVGPAAYLQGPQGGATSSFNPVTQANLQFELIASNGTTVLASGNTAAIGLPESITNFALAAGTYYIKVVDQSGSPNAVQAYRMTNQIAQGGVTGSITPVSPDPRITPVSSISISFSEPVSGFDIGDLILSRDGFSESLAGAILTDSGDHQNYTLSNLSGSTDRVGQFNLGFTGTTGITGNTSGDPFAAGSLEVWQMNGLNGTGANDVIKLVKNSGDNTLTDVYFNSGGSVAYSFKTATASNVQVFGNAGDDVLTIDYSLGQPLTNGGGSFDAGSNTATGDKLVWVGETGADAYTVTASSVNRTSPTAVPFGVSNNEALDFTTGTYTLVSDVGANVAVRIGPSTTAAFTSTQHVRDLVIENGALVNFMQNGNQRLVTSGLTLNGNGMLDMFDNDMILEYSGATPLATIENAIRFARNGGLWNTIGGITSTSARTAAQPNKTLGAIEASDWKTVVGGSALFDNEVVDNTSILVKYTYYGDYDFNGKVDGSDYARVDARFNDQLTFGNIGGWFNGDFDYNGKVDGGDYALIDGAYSSQSGTL